MARTEKSVIINRPVDPVFDYASNFDNLPEWETSFIEAVKTSEKSKGIGTTHKGALKLLGMTMDWTSRFTEYEENTRIDVTITAGKTVLKKQMQFDETHDGKTEFTLVHELKVGGFMKLLTPVILLSMRGEMKEHVANLKEIMEREGQG